MKFDMLPKQTSRREILRGSMTLAGSGLRVYFFPSTLLRASAAGYAHQSPSPADLLASIRAKFNVRPLGKRKRLLTMSRCSTAPAEP